MLVIYLDGKPYAQGYYYLGFGSGGTFAQRSCFFDFQNRKLRLDMSLNMWGREHADHQAVKMFFANAPLHSS